MKGSKIKTEKVKGGKEKRIMRREVPLKVTIALIPLAMALCAFGIYRGEVAVVLSKAINICMECIGLG